jgi:hypothetical protein
MGILDLKDDFGAVGNGLADDALPLQNFFDALRSNGGKGRIPPHDAGKFYKTTQPIVTDRAMTIEGPGPASGIIMGVGLPSGSRIIDFDCLATDVVEHVDISGLTLRSDNGLPGAMRVKNASYHHTSNVRVHGVASGVEYTGTRCFSNSTDRLVGYGVSGSTIKFKDFTGGGNFTFSKDNISGDIGIHVDSNSVVTQMAVDSDNFEGCGTHSMRIDGTVDGLEMILRAEGGHGAYDFAITPVSGHQVTGLSARASFFHANSAGTIPWLIGGYGGKVIGFDISGNTVDNAALDYFVFLNGGGNSGTVHSNRFKQAATQAINGPRLGVRVFSNENATGQCIEYDGAIASTPGVNDVDWTPTDTSGAGLTFSTAAAKASKIGRMVFWQAVVVYPANSSGAAAVIGGLPFPIVTTPVVSGRAGGSANLSNSGVALGLMHGAASSSSVSVFNPSGLSSIANAALSGKELYLSGFYAT